MYMQMGGNAGDGATLARQTGATQAAAALGVDLKAQFSAWAPETMINQFKEAVAAKPTCIEIMGHPGGTAFHDLVKARRRPGHHRHRRQLADDRPAGASSAPRAWAMPASTSMPAARSPPRTCWPRASSPATRRWSTACSARPSAASPRRASPIRSRRPASRSTGSRSARRSTATPRSAYRCSSPTSRAIPNLKAIGTQHGGVTGLLADILKKAGKKPGDIIVGGIDLAPATIDGLKSGYVSATLDQLLYLQGFMPVLQCVLTAKYKMPGLTLNTGAGTVTPETIDALVELIDAGIR